MALLARQLAVRVQVLCSFSSCHVVSISLHISLPGSILPGLPKLQSADVFVEQPTATCSAHNLCQINLIKYSILLFLLFCLFYYSYPQLSIHGDAVLNIVPWLPKPAVLVV